jgi:two-component system cell cycle response regulator DivK
VAKEKILIVEDNDQNMRLIEMTLRAKNHLLLKATDGEQAMAMAVKDKPDLIIMDIQLPKMNGLEVTSKLRQMPDSCNTPVIAVTAYAMKCSKEEAIDAGCNTYLSKPINTHQLRETVAELLLQSRKDYA